MRLDAVARAAGCEGLAVLGALHPEPDDAAPPGTGTLVLLGPGRDMWTRFQADDEYRDGAPDPLDRWSVRVIGRLAARLGAAALFPFEGPPYLPFQAWARRSGRAWDSPVGLLVHEHAGLFVSFRGALALPGRLDLPPPGRRPCDTCAAPCIGACPVGALGVDGYDVPACRQFLETPPGSDCLTRGCAVRRACPVGPGQAATQSAFHMAAFRGSPAKCVA